MNAPYTVPEILMNGRYLLMKKAIFEIVIDDGQMWIRCS
jgi:hypothetical protein